ncbi:unnamed protein product [Symbiodinium necroappetens]|uniref:Uncharacterized protein n=1 Tax=Symbiodinium necroappetens TaxID=1628268 RepID=A0A812ST93_9DINO|nr:unnamed protein product [Symbiodinium necroappetens]
MSMLDPAVVSAFLAESLATDRQGGRLLKKIGSNGHCGTQGTAERIRRVYAMPADLPPVCRTPDSTGSRPDRQIPLVPRSSSGQAQLVKSSSTPTLKYQPFDPARTGTNLKHNRHFDVPFPQLLFQHRVFQRD